MASERTLGLVVDSIMKIVPDFDHIFHLMKPGASMRSMADEIEKGKIRIGGFRALWFHVGTNAAAPVAVHVDGVQRMVAPSVDDVMAQYRRLKNTIRFYNRDALLLFSSVLPRLCDFETTGALVLAVNTRLKTWCRGEANTCFVDVYEEFTHKSGQHMGEPKRHLFSSKDDLHLSREGLVHLADVLRPHMSLDGLKIMLRGERASPLIR